MHNLVKLAMVFAVMLFMKARADSGWNTAARGNTVRVSTPSSNIGARINSGERVKMLKWGDNLEHFENIALNFRLRHGSMYSLLSVNEMGDIVDMDVTKMDSGMNGEKFNARYESAGGGAEMLTEYFIDEKNGSLEVRFGVKNTSGKALRCQLQLEPVVTGKNGSMDIALGVPLPGRFKTVRPLDPSMQAIPDQDGHRTCERTFRLSRPFLLLVSPSDRQSVLIEGSNIQFVKAWRQWKDTSRFNVHGKVFVLDPGQEHQETYLFRLVDGLVSDSFSAEPPLVGWGAMLENSYVTRGDMVKAIFSSPPGAAVKATVFSAGKPVGVYEGREDIDIPLGSLSDGEYRVVMEVKDENGKVFVRNENLTLWRRRWADMARQVSELSSFLTSFDTSTSCDKAVAEHRIELLKWKLSEVEAYKALNEAEQAEGLLLDAWNIKKVLEEDFPAVYPEPGEIIYSNDFSVDTDDFMFYGTADLSFERENGMTVKPSGTTNIWSRFRLDGSYMVELEFFAPSGYRGGTFVQFNGEAFNPVRENRLMASASWGSMEYYNFNTRTYHFSFSAFTRGKKARNEARFRKTGAGFYILSKTADPVNTDEWHKMAFIKKGNQFLFFCNGKLVLEYFDIGAQGPVLESGRLGFRIWGESCSSLKNLRVSRID